MRFTGLIVGWWIGFFLVSVIAWHPDYLAPTEFSAARFM
jgi:hypothetical protein